MYGLIHSAARELVLERMGPEMWANILETCGLSEEHFINGKRFDDDVTFSLIGAIVENTGMPLEDVLRTFGKYWIGYARETSYGSIFRLVGNDIETFISNLNRMHQSISTSMPEAEMPQFDVVASSEHDIAVIYKSVRQGLEPFVQGLFEALLEHFNQTGSVAYQPANDGIRFQITRSKDISAVA